MNKYIIVTLFLTILMPMHVNAEKVIFLKNHFKPFHTMDNEGNWVGILDEIDNIIINTYKIETEKKFRVYTLPRLLYKLANTKQTSCISGLLKSPEREKMFLFSTPIDTTYSNKIIIRKEFEHLFSPYVNKNGAISLYSLLKNKELIAGINYKRVYTSNGKGMYVDMKFSKSNTILKKSENYTLEGVIRLLAMKRVHYIIGYEVELEAHINNKENKDLFGLKKSNFLAYPIEEYSTATVYFACSKTRLGKKTISDINKVLNSKQFRVNLARLYAKWPQLDVSRQSLY